MTKLQLKITTAAAALFLATSAQAADLAPIPPAPVDLWTGFHIGIGGGGAYNFTDLATSGEAYLVDEAPFAFDDFLGSNLYNVHGAELGEASAFGTVEIGYDWQFSEGFVLGILGSFDFGKGKWADAYDTKASMLPTTMSPRSMSTLKPPTAYAARTAGSSVAALAGPRTAAIVGCGMVCSVIRKPRFKHAALMISKAVSLIPMAPNSKALCRVTRSAPARTVAASPSVAV